MLKRWNFLKAGFYEGIKELSFEGTDFFAKYGPDDGEALRRVVAEFLTPNDALIRDYILRTLDAAFFLEASGLRKETLDKLSSLSGGQRSLTLFLDTNLLFSVLNLHDNPSNQSVNALLQLISEIDAAVNCKLYALPITVDEFRRVISATCEELKQVSFTGSMAAAARASGKFSGAKIRYVEACQEAGGPINPEDFFGPYLSNPVAVMRHKGVELYNDKLEKYSQRQDVVDSINELWDSMDAVSKTEGSLQGDRTRYDAPLLY